MKIAMGEFLLELARSTFEADRHYEAIHAAEEIIQALPESLKQQTLRGARVSWCLIHLVAGALHEGWISREAMLEALGVWLHTENGDEPLPPEAIKGAIQGFETMIDSHIKCWVSIKGNVGQPVDFMALMKGERK